MASLGWKELTELSYPTPQPQGVSRHTQGECLIPIVDVAAGDANCRELHFVGQLYGVVAVLQFLHVAAHGLVGRPVHLVPVHDAWLDFIE